MADLTLDNKEKELYCKLATFVNENSVEAMTVKNLKDYDSSVLSFISHRLGGIKKVKRTIDDGTLNLSSYLILPEYVQPVSESVYEEIDPSITSMIPNDSILCKGIDANFFDALSIDEVTVKKEITLESLSDSIKALTEKQDEMVELLKLYLSSTLSNSDIISNKLKILEGNYIDNIRKDIKDNIIKYALLKFGNKEQQSIRAAWNEAYLLIKKMYDIDLERINTASLMVVNKSRLKRGESEILNPNSKGISKIEIVEKLGMLPELYMIVKDMLNKVPLNVI